MSKYWQRNVSALCLLFFAFGGGIFSAEELPLEGHWEGVIEIPGSSLEFNVDFKLVKEKEYSGDITIPAQNARNLPLSDIRLENNHVTFSLSGIPGNPVFSGESDAVKKTISGDFTQSGQTYPFRMEKTSGLKTRAKNSLSGFDELVERGLKSLNVPGIAVAVVVEDEVVLAEGFGLRDLENEYPMTANTLLAIGSASKAFTTFALGTVADKGLMEWEKPVQTYIPWFRMHDLFASERLTPRDLVTHRSGLPRHDLVWYNDTELSREELVRRLVHLKPSAGLRSRFQYNNLMFLTAGYLLEVLTEETWEQAVRSLVLEPLKMERTNFSVDASQQDPDHARPYREEDEKLERIPFRSLTNMGPAGSINSSVNEMSRWIMVHLNQGKFESRQLIQPETLRDMHLAHMTTGATPSIPEVIPCGYGLGWFVDTYRGHRRVHHGGNIDGFSAMVSLFPQNGLGFVLIANKNGTGLPELLIRHAADKIFGHEEKDWIGEAAKEIERGREIEKKAQEKGLERRIEDTSPTHSLKEYTGVYRHPGYGELNVFLKNEQLHFVFNQIITPLEHWHYETFNGQRGTDPTFEDMKIIFRTDINGRVSALEAPFEPTLEEIKFQKQPDPKYYDPSYLSRFTGTYNLGVQTLQVNLKGDILTLIIPGQPEYELIPDLGGEFILDRAKAIRVSFKTDETGSAKALMVIQAGGVYQAEKVKQK